MQYANMEPGRFLARPNRFVAQVALGDGIQTVHVKNTGRCRELLQPGARVWCQRSGNPSRKTLYDLIAVEKGARLINMDSQAPNLAAGEWLSTGRAACVAGVWGAQVVGASRRKISFTLEGKLCFLEVKGVTLENQGICAFPDAPTARGAKHLQGLIQAVRQGYGAYVLFVIQMEQVRYLHPNDQTDPAFGAALREAAAAGVAVLAMDCHVTPEEMVLRQPVPVKL